MSTVWKPSVTVAAIIARPRSGDMEFLMVEEETADGLRINQPAGHLDPGESLIQAVERETLEETAHDFSPTALIGAYLSRSQPPSNRPDVTYLRFAICGELGAKHDRALDHGIVRCLWMSTAEIRASQERHRSPLVLKCIEDFLAGQRAPLSLLYAHPSALT